MRISDWSSDVCSSDLLLCRRPVCGIDAGGRWTGLRLHRWRWLKLTGKRQRHRRLDDLERHRRFDLLNGRTEIDGLIMERRRRGFAHAGSKRQREARHEQQTTHREVTLRTAETSYRKTIGNTVK